MLVYTTSTQDEVAAAPTRLRKLREMHLFLSLRNPKGWLAACRYSDDKHATARVWRMSRLGL